MSKLFKKKEPEVETKTTSGPIRFSKLSPEQKQAVIVRIGAGEVALQGPDHHVVEIKH